MDENAPPTTTSATPPVDPTPVAPWIPSWVSEPPAADPSFAPIDEPPPPPPTPPRTSTDPPGGPGPGQRRPGPTRWRKVVPVTGLVALSLVGGGIGGWLAAGREDTSSGPSVSAAPAAFRTDGTSLDVAAVVQQLKPSVVSIETTIESRRGPFVAQGQGAGTGIVLDDSGHILTNAHVIDGATSITVTIAGETTPRAATLVAADTTADVAVIRVSDTSGLVPAKLGDSSRLQVGDQVVAIGNALALEGGLTVTEGIVSAVDRSIDGANGTLDGLIQTDAAISSGNSGGALVDSAGEVIGMNTAVATSGGGISASNIGFAISINTALQTAQRLMGQAST